MATMPTMGGESRAAKQRVKDRIDPIDKDRKEESTTSAGDDETRMYAKLILAKVRKLEVEVGALSLKCSEPGPRSTSGKADGVNFEAEEEENEGRGSHGRGHKRGDSKDLRRFKKDMAEKFRKVNDEMASLRKLVASLVDHVKEAGSESKASTREHSSSSSPSEFSSNVFAAVSDDDSMSEVGSSLNVDTNPTSSAGLIKRTKAKKVKVGNGRPHPGPANSNFNDDGDDVVEGQQELTEAMQKSMHQKRTGASKERMNNKSNCAVTREQEAGKKTKQLTRTPAVPKVTARPGPSTQSLLSDQSIPANQLGTRNASSSRDPKNRLLRKKETGNKLDCIFCQKKFKAKCTLEEHILRHIKERPHFCNLCPFESSSKTVLKRHLETHKPDRERRFQCDLCPKRFFSKDVLKQHTNECHTVGKQFKCEVCNKCFGRKETLTRHMLVHTGEKNHCCGICNKKFTHKHHLEQHIRIHTGERPFKCRVCGKSFNSSSFRCRHKRQQHQQ